MKNKPTVIEKEKFKGQTKRVWYQKGCSDTKIRIIKLINDFENPYEHLYNANEWHDFESFREQIIRLIK